MILAAIGVYGAISYLVTQGAHDIGVRIALGASRGNILKMVVRRGMGLAGAGIACGLIGAAALTQLMASLLFGVSAHDAAAFTAGADVSGGSGAGGVLCAGAESDAGRSDGGAAGRVTGLASNGVETAQFFDRPGKAIGFPGSFANIPIGPYKFRQTGIVIAALFGSTAPSRNDAVPNLSRPGASCRIHKSGFGVQYRFGISGRPSLRNTQVQAAVRSVGEKPRFNLSDCDSQK
jgi:ABC-type antimicrobial peptide transport system permease subunit